MKKKVLVVMHDPGGTKAVTAATLKLIKDPEHCECVIYAGKFAAPWLKDNDISFHEMDVNVEATEVRRVFEVVRPNVLLSGTSWASNLEQSFRNQAAAQGIPSVVFFDYWMNYATRFLHADYPITATKDWLCVTDADMAQEVHSEGFPKDRIVIVGHPHLDYLAENREKYLQSAEKLGEYSSIFISENYPETYLQSLTKHPILAFAEAFSFLLNEKGIEKADFHVKLHPKEESSPVLEKALQEIKNVARLNLRILDQKITLLNKLSSYEYAFGYQSMGLFEAKALGLKTLALPLLKGDRYPSLFKAMNKCGIKFARFNSSEILSAMRELASENDNDYKGNSFSGSSKKLSDFVLKI